MGRPGMSCQWYAAVKRGTIQGEVRTQERYGKQGTKRNKHLNAEGRSVEAVRWVERNDSRLRTGYWSTDDSETETESSQTESSQIHRKIEIDLKR